MRWTLNRLLCNHGQRVDDGLGVEGELLKSLSIRARRLVLVVRHLRTQHSEPGREELQLKD